MSEHASTAVIEDGSPAQPKTTQSTSLSGVGRQTLIYGLGIVAAKAISFLMLPVYTRFLTPADYGIMELIEMTLELVTIVAGAQLALGVFRFFHKAQTEQEKKAVVSTALFALGVSYSFVGVAGFLFADPLSSLVFGTPEHGGLLRIASASLAFESLSIVPFAYARAKDRSVFFVLVSLFRTLLAMTLNLVFLIGLDLGIAAILLGGLITNVIVGTGLAVSMIREVGFRVSTPAVKDLLRYGGPLIATQLATFIVTFGNRFFLQAAGNSTEVGLYTMAHMFGFMVALVGAAPFMRVWDPKRFAVASRPDRDEIYARGFIYLNLLLITVALLTAVFIEELLRVMATPAFYPAASLVPVILIAYVLQSWSAIQDTGILLKERTEYVMLANWIAAGAALAGYALLVPRFMGWGAAVATVVAFAVRHVMLFTISQRLCYIRYEWAPVLRLVALALVIFAVSTFIPPLALWASIAAKSVLAAVFFVTVWRSRILSERERSIARDAARALRAQLLAARGAGKTVPGA